MSNVSISTNNLTIGYDHTIVQRNVSFSLHRGEMVCMLGKNGCGKSTLLRTLAGLLPAINGSFTIHPNVPSTAASGCPTHPSIALVLTERLSLESTSVQGIMLNTAQKLKEINAFTQAFGMDIFHPLT